MSHVTLAQFYFIHSYVKYDKHLLTLYNLNSENLFSLPVL